MERVDLTVRGEGVGELPSAIRGIPPEKREDYNGDGFAVVVSEQFYFRTISNMQTTVVFDLVDETTCEVTVVTGGGGAGLLQDDLGSEGTESRNVVGKIRAFCRDRDLEVDAD